MFERLVLLKQVPLKPDLALLLLRIVFFGFLFVKHGLVDLTTFGALSHTFKDPIHIGPLPSLIMATISDALCAVLIVVGLATRWAALYTVVIHFVVAAFIFHLTLMTQHPNADVPLQYVGAGLALYFMGAGKYSLDAMIHGDRQLQPAV